MLQNLKQKFDFGTIILFHEILLGLQHVLLINILKQLYKFDLYFINLIQIILNFIYFKIFK